MHRVTGKAWSAQSCPLASPVVTYTYDSGPNAKGHLTGVTDQAGTASYSYDVLGRLASETRVIAGISKSISYDYNLDGSLKTLHYPSGAAITYTPDSAGRILSAIDSGNSINYVTSATYQADGQMTGFVSGNGGAFAGITSAFSYNKRLQPVNMSANAPSQTVRQCFPSATTSTWAMALRAVITGMSGTSTTIAIARGTRASITTR